MSAVGRVAESVAFRPRAAWWQYGLKIGMAGYVYLFFFTTIPALRANRFDYLLAHVVDFPTLAAQWSGDDFDPFGVISRLPILIGASALLLLAAGMGRLAIDALRMDAWLSRAEQVVFSIALGGSLLSLFTLAWGLLGGFRYPMVAYGLCAAVALGCGWRMRSWASADDNTRAAAGSSGRWMFWLVAAFVVLMLLGGMLPPWHYDVRAYHLQAPKDWYMDGAVHFMPHNVYANMPLAAEMPALFAMTLVPGNDGWWWGALMGKTVIASYGPLTALAIYVFGIRFLSKAAALVSAAVFISVPWVSYLSMTGLIECVIACYFVLALHGFLLYCHGDRKGTHDDEAAATFPRWRWLLLSGWMAGSAAACKYPALVFVVLPIGIALFARELWSSRRQSWRPVLAWTFAVTSACGLWYAKNAVTTGNPTYPMLYSIFGGKNWDPDKQQRWHEAHAPQPDEQGKRFSIAHAVHALQRVGWTSTGHSFLLWPLAAFGIVSGTNRKVIYLLLAGIATYLVMWWLLTHRFDRFWTPMLPLAAILAGAGGATLWQDGRRRWLVAALLFGGAMNLFFSTTRALGDNRFVAPLAVLRLEANPFHRYLNSTLTQEDCVLLVGDATPFDLRIKYQYSTCFDDCLLEQVVRCGDAEAQSRMLRQSGITHVYVNWQDIAAFRRERDYGFAPLVTRATVQQLVDRGVLIPLSESEAGQIFRVPSATPLRAAMTP